MIMSWGEIIDIFVLSSLPGIGLGIGIICRVAYKDRKRRKEWAAEDAERARKGLRPL